MAKLIYAANISLDGYIEDERGNIEWTISDDETYAFWTDFQRSIGTYLYGRRMYESMVYWETVSTTWVEASEHCRTTSACGSNCSVSAASEAALFIFTTA
ncbi:hypothetical protein PAECIP111893_04157 [Paenibacillus plantiphilus]|uniref:Bacterial bifunctional deaminase-reductase C-terminal domain-containing protein n=1 Tax=Paenibacillus plantiphilus TaxID=2905650 RepID=A0ABM9CKC2_9BACL|nr:dihydrofolate reductase family protein [Paenibacillus plantiphilus]CAH1216741.1 hypothetical protein PAECIP111893_04157 [Paenibacillus plantiphilus]